MTGQETSYSQSVNMDQIRQRCDDLANQVSAGYPGLDIKYIIHRHGERGEAIDREEGSIESHPASDIALKILHHDTGYEHSAFLGLAATSTTQMMGLRRSDHLMGLITLNVDDYKNYYDALLDIYHFTWHAIDMGVMYKRPEYRNKYKHGPMLPKRSPMSFTKANLQADIFGSVLLDLEGQKKAILNLAIKRARQSLETNPYNKPAYYPFPICHEATESAAEEIQKAPSIKSRRIKMARQMSVEIGKAYDDNTIQRWWGFAEPAQKMAWRGTRSVEILAAAQDTPSDLYIRATAIQVAELLNIATDDVFLQDDQYNAFRNSTYNEAIHRRKIEETFEIVMAEGLENNSAQPLLSAANMQNEKLTQGSVIGWCAAALQSAARAFDTAMARGKAPDQAARLEFQGSQHAIEWDSLHKLSSTIVDERRSGFEMTMGDVVNLCENDKELAPVMESIKFTMDTPEYQPTLETGQELNIPGPMAEPQISLDHAPAPKGPATPAPAMAPSVPGMGPGGGGGVRRPPATPPQDSGRDKTRKHEDSKAKNKSSDTGSLRLDEDDENDS